MKSYEQLPEGYREILHIDLQKDKKLMLTVNLLSIPVCLVMVVLYFVLLISGKIPAAFEIPQVIAMLVSIFVYVILHEAVHAVFMRRYCTAKVKFGFTGMYAYAGSNGYYCRKHYITIALAPVVIWGIVLAVLNIVLPPVCFLPVYMTQMMNLSGAAGDLYVSWRFRKLPRDILVRDSGVAMTVYSRED